MWFCVALVAEGAEVCLATCRTMGIAIVPAVNDWQVENWQSELAAWKTFCFFRLTRAMQVPNSELGEYALTAVAAPEAMAADAVSFQPQTGAPAPEPTLQADSQPEPEPESEPETECDDAASAAEQARSAKGHRLGLLQLNPFEEATEIGGLCRLYFRATETLNPVRRTISYL